MAKQIDAKMVIIEKVIGIGKELGNFLKSVVNIACISASDTLVQFSRKMLDFEKQPLGFLFSWILREVQFTNKYGLGI